MENNMLVGVQERPKAGQWVVLSLQHVFAMFGATVLVPLLTGLDVGVALVASGIGTLIYIACTKGKVPVYLGSSFAYIAAIITAINTSGIESAYVGLMVVGVIYAIISTIIRFTGNGWLKKLLPPVVVGPMIIIIGLGLAPIAISSAGIGEADDTFYSARLSATADYSSVDQDSYSTGEFNLSFNDTGELVVITAAGDSTDFEVDGLRLFASDSKLYEYDQETNKYNLVKSDFYKKAIVAVITFLSVVGVALLGKGFFKIVPFLIAILVGYTAAVIFGLVDITKVFTDYSFMQLPNFTFIGTYKLDWSAVLMFAPIAFVTIAEHIGDHTVLGEVTGKDFIEDPGLENTILGDGIATFVSAAIGGPANTTYGENTGVVAMTRVGSVYVTGLAAIFAISLGFFGYIQAFINSIPWAVIGGMTIILYGLIAGNGVKVLVKSKVDLGNMRNLIIVATMLVIGLGGATIALNDVVSLTGMSLAALVGIVLNQILPKNIEA